MGIELTANPIIATRPTKSSFSLVKPIPPEVPKIPSSTLTLGFSTYRRRKIQLKIKLGLNIQQKAVFFIISERFD
jgi:hypothetical protein